MSPLPAPDPARRHVAPPPAQYASFARRAVSSVADGGLTQVITLIVRVLATFLVADRLDLAGKTAELAVALESGGASESELRALAWAAIAVLVFWLAAALVINVAYFALQEGSSRSATVGKRLVRLQVVNAATLQPISRRRAAARTAAKLLSLAPLGLGYLAMLWHPQRRCWHDRICGTAVILDRGE